MIGELKISLIVFLYHSINLVITMDTHTLQCADIENEIQLKEEIVGGYVKRKYRGFYQGHPVVLSFPSDSKMREDFEHGLKMLIIFQGSGFVTELKGYCLDKENLKMVTNYYKHGSLDNLDRILNEFDADESWNKRIELAKDYLSIIEFLHENHRVMCDSNDLKKTLSQYLITDDYRLIVNDLDALPKVLPNKSIKCGHKELFGEFVAPEQLWPYDDRPFSDDEMVGYDEKTDIWKVPNVILFLLGSSSKATRIKVMLFDLFGRCKNIEPSQRPTAREVKKTFGNIVKSMRKKIEL